MVDEALAALLARHRAAEVDASYAAYDTHPRRARRVGKPGVVPSGGCSIVTNVPARGRWWCDGRDRAADPWSSCLGDAAILFAMDGPHRAMHDDDPEPSRSEVLLEPGADPVPLPSAVNLDSVESVSLAILVERLGRLAEERMRQVCAALAIAVDCST
ncbi:MAG: type II toxin-antitoxin system PemK/MazF family toxin [Nocardioides sp.]